MTIMDPLRFVASQLDELSARGLLRMPRTEPESPDRLVLCSNDYLGYAQDPPMPADRTACGGSGASRLISGDSPSHRQLEAQVAEWMHTEAALLFSSGYAANVGVVSSLMGKDDVIISDALNHASIIDGCRLSRAQVKVVPHRDTDAVEDALLQHQGARARLVVTDAYFSMDGHCPDVTRLRELCSRHDAALMVDEAHALGVFGPQGRGVCARQNVSPDILIGTLGKAVGLQGAFVAASQSVCHWLWNRARSFVFSTAPSPWLASALSARIARLAADDAARTRLSTITERFRTTLLQRGAPIGGSEGPIIPWHVGDSEKAVRFSRELSDAGLFVQAIRPPTVAPGTSRLRITLHARLSDAELDHAIACLSRLL